MLELEKLVEASRGGCVDSFAALYKRYYNAMVALGYSITADMHLAEDAAQQSFAIACRDLPRLRRNDRFAAWLAGICRNTAKQIRKSKNISLDFDVQDSSRKRDEIQSRNLAVRRVVWDLRQRDREPIVMRYYDNLSYEQIADVLGISAQAVHGRLTRAKRKVAKLLEQNNITGADYERL